MSRTYRCVDCGAKLDPSVDAPTMRCEFCGTVTEKDAPRRKAPPAAAPPPTDDAGPGTKKNKKDEKKREWFIFVYLGSIALVAAGTFGYEYLLVRRTVTGTPIVADIDGDGVEDLLMQWDEEVHDTRTARVGLIDGRTRRIAWSFAFSKKRYANPLPMALGSGYLIIGEPKPIADILDAKTGAIRHMIDLPDVASHVYANGMSAWIDTDRKALRVDASSGKATRAEDPPLGSDRPAWAPFDASQSCPSATCKSTAPMPIADMNVHDIRFDDTSGESDDAVAIGQKENGTHLPMLAGISRSKKTTLWSRVLTASDEATPQHPVIARERVTFEYSDGGFRHLACVSLTSGEIVWDVKSDENAPRAIDIVVGTNVYVRRGSAIELHDPKSGKLVERFF